ncbi:MAG: M48 family metalloprotease [Chloroflexota bacterium]
MPRIPRNTKTMPDIPLWQVIRAWLFIPGLYLVLALSIIVMAAIGGGLILGIWLLAEWLSQTEPTLVLAIIGLGMLAGILAALVGIIRTLRRETQFAPAILLDLSAEPRLVSFVSELCERMNTKIPDSIVLHADVNFMIQKGPLRVFNGEARGQVLAIGLPVISFISVNELRAILAHELAHFTGNDALLSSAVLPVYMKLAATIESMDKALGVSPGGKVTRRKNIGCMAVPMILPWLALSIHWWSFHRFNVRISRLRESRADVVAALTCGSESLTGALRKVGGLRRASQAIFNKDFASELRDRKPATNYCLRLRNAVPDLDALIVAQEALGMRGDENIIDTHPVLQERLRDVPKVEERFMDHRPATEILLKLHEYEEQATQFLTTSLTVVVMEDEQPVVEETQKE